MKKRMLMFATSSFAAFLFTIAQFGVGTNSWGVFYAPEIPESLRK